MISTEERLKIFQDENNIYTKGPLSLVVQFTRLVHPGLMVNLCFIMTIPTLKPLGFREIISFSTMKNCIYWQ